MCIAKIAIRIGKSANRGNMNTWLLMINELILSSAKQICCLVVCSFACNIVVNRNKNLRKALLLIRFPLKINELWNLPKKLDEDRVRTKFDTVSQILIYLKNMEINNSVNVSVYLLTRIYIFVWASGLDMLIINNR